MARKWNLSNSKAPRGQLDQATRFFSTPKELAVCSVRIPIEVKVSDVEAAVSGLISEHIQSLELWWDKKACSLRFVLATDRPNIDDLRQAFASMYPNASIDDMDRTIPEWFDPQSQYRIFDVGTRHGHYTAVFDNSKAHKLVTKIATAIQRFDHAWFQILFKEHDSTKFLSSHTSRLVARSKEIQSNRHQSLWDIIQNNKPHAHPEQGYDFANNFQGLLSHATMKKQGRHVILCMRGLLEGSADTDMNFGDIQTLPIGDIQSRYEHLVPFWYDYDKFYSDTKESIIKIPGRDTIHRRIDIFPMRLIPHPAQFLNKAKSEYFDKKWWGILGYRKRNPLPFLFLTVQEMPLFLHLPSHMVPNTDITRGAYMPQGNFEDTGASIGSSVPQNGSVHHDGNTDEDTSESGGPNS